MLHAVAASVIAYISTNVDDIFVLMFLLAQVRAKARSRLVAGHFIGVGVLTLVSLLGALGLQRLPLRYLGLLGLVPIVLGIRAWFQYRQDREDSELPRVNSVGLVSMALITVSNGADNAGVYIPLFAGFTGAERISAVLVFAGMTVVWVALARLVAQILKVRLAVEKYRQFVIPAVLVILGIYIILDSGLFLML